METFELRRTADSRYFFTFLDDRGEPIADSQIYETKRSALDAIDLLRRHARDAFLDDRTTGVESCD